MFPKNRKRMEELFDNVNCCSGFEDSFEAHHDFIHHPCGASLSSLHYARH